MIVLADRRETGDRESSARSTAIGMASIPDLGGAGNPAPPRSGEFAIDRFPLSFSSHTRPAAALLDPDGRKTIAHYF
jgi:hypothetical protein